MRRGRHAAPRLPLLVLAVFVVLVFFTAAAKVSADHATELPPALIPEEFTPPAAEELSTQAPSAAATEYIPDEADVEMLARLIWGEARGVPSDMEKAAVAWCALNRVDAPEYPDTLAEVVTQPYQFNGYSPDYPATAALKALAADVLTRWEREKREGGDVGRVLPAEYFFFTGDGERNTFRTEWRGGEIWDWSLPNPYNS